MSGSGNLPLSQEEEGPHNRHQGQAVLQYSHIPNGPTGVPDRMS